MHRKKCMHTFEDVTLDEFVLVWSVVETPLELGSCLGVNRRFALREGTSVGIG